MRVYVLCCPKCHDIRRVKAVNQRHLACDCGLSRAGLTQQTGDRINIRGQAIIKMIDDFRKLKDPPDGIVDDKESVGGDRRSFEGLEREREKFAHLGERHRHRK